MSRILTTCLALLALAGCVSSDRSRDERNSCTDACDYEDQVKCDDEQFRLCVLKSSGCLGWTAPHDCPDEGRCDASKNACVPPCEDQCEADAARCTGSGLIQSCRRASSGCLEWSAAENCTSGERCDADRGACMPCTNACASGDTQCTGSQIQQCMTDENGCRSWAIPTDCPSGKTCFGTPAICVACQSDCGRAGATRCSATKVQVCQQVSTGCLRWSTPTFCAGTSVCDATLNRCESDPCNGVPVEGRCAGSTSIEYCAVASGAGQPELRVYNCPTGEACTESARGATCTLVGVCRPETTRCLSTSQLQVCDASGQWRTQTCTNAVCRDSGLGASCVPTSTTRQVSGTLTYEARAPRTDFSDWQAQPFTAPLAGITILSYSGQNVIDSVMTDANGGFKVQVPSSPNTNDRIVAVAANADKTGNLLFFVADPGFSRAGEYDPDEVGSNPRVWSWSWATNSLGSAPALKIKEADGSGAARIFDFVRKVYHSTSSDLGGQAGLSLVAWIGYGTSWTCGACFAPWPANVLGYNMESQIWFPADSNQSYWADSVTAHELGHWVMDSYGTSPDEGGTHYIGNPTFPGQAWSEGFATWFSSETRDNGYYYDKQGGTMFWLNIDSRTYDDGTPWQRPKPANGLLQRIDENEVSAVLWKLSNSSTTAYKQMLTALAAPKMNRSPWARGYTRHTWQLSGTTFVNVNDTRIPKPMLADFLDTLVCSGFSKPVVDSATNPSTAYPYPSNAPLCQ